MILIPIIIAIIIIANAVLSLADSDRDKYDHFHNW